MGAKDGRSGTGVSLAAGGGGGEGEALWGEAVLPPRAAVGWRVYAANAAGAGEALLLAEFYRRHAAETGGGVFFVARGPLEAWHLMEEMAFLAPDVPLRYLPDWETLPYDAFSPSADITGRRIATLAALLDGGRGVTVTTAAAALLPCAPPGFIGARAFLLRVGEALDLPALQGRLLMGGYARVDRVLAQGEYALYGGQIDIFPPDAAMPLRLVLADEEIEQIRLFDVESQRSVERIGEFSALPMSECDFSPEGRRRFAAHYDALFDDDRAMVKKRVREGVPVAGIEYYLPLFFETAASVLEYLPDNAAVVMHENLSEAMVGFLGQARQRQQVVNVYDDRPTLPVGQLFVGEEAFFAALRRFAVTVLQAPAGETRAPEVPVNARADDSHGKLLEFIRGFKGRVTVAVDGDGRCEALADVLRGLGAAPARCGSFAECLRHELAICVAPLRAGFVAPAARLAVVTETEIFLTPLPPRARRAAAAGAGGVEGLLADEIRDGDYVVHRQYGVGVARGLKNKEFDGEVGEYLEIEYADTQRLFLPISQLHLLERHHGGTELSKMGGRGWRRAAARAARRAHDAAARLLETHARRAAAAATAHAPDRVLMARFVEAFAHAETPDQQRAADETLADLMSDKKPMDRLVAADVGFGKTEVAMRAAAAVTLGGAQAAVMAPTTLLAQQHYRNFVERFAGFPVRVAALTRLTGAGERRALLADLAAGRVDIAVGTHALLSTKVKFASLGLVVVDEEHRFGVTHKERLKNLRAGVDVLALSATPIPRTLSMALGGVRDLSVMSTPPAARLPIKTIEAPFSEAVVREACERELLRGGQVFFVHNEIASMKEMAARLGEWLPQARIIVAHGGMGGGELEDAMRRFLRRQGEILLCTTIVESGLDIANANTIVINRADKMGLSRLHQLRGRVGRGGVQAYAYLLRPLRGEIGKNAEARLAAAMEYSALGSGFFLSMRDLEIRGAGEILGERQSGDIEAVGCAMYQRMVNAAARQLRGEPEVESDVERVVNFAAPALLPAAYIPAAAERMRYYRRLARCADGEELNEVFLEWEDRFGKPPAEARLLKESHRVRTLMGVCGAVAVRVGSAGQMRMTFAAETPCAAVLVEKITVGECLPAADNGIRKQLKSLDSLQHALEVGEFLRGLRAAANLG